MKLLSTGNPKILKGLAQGYNTYILHLAPADLSGYNTCPKATAGCKSACLNTAGRGGLFKKGTTTNVIQEARMRKTAFFFEERKHFMEWLVADIKLAIKELKFQLNIPLDRQIELLTYDLNLINLQNLQIGILWSSPTFGVIALLSKQAQCKFLSNPSILRRKLLLHLVLSMY